MGWRGGGGWTSWSVIFSDKFLLSMSYVNLEVPQFQFIDRVVDIPVFRAETCTHSANCAEDLGGPTGAVLGQCLRLALVVLASVRFPTLHEAHHLRVVSAIRVWLGNEYGFRRPSLEREVQLEVRVHSSSCGTHRDVVHSPLKGSTIVATATVVFFCFVGRLHSLCGPIVLRGCLRRDVVW